MYGTNHYYNFTVILLCCVTACNTTENIPEAESDDTVEVVISESTDNEQTENQTKDNILESLEQTIP